MSIIMAVYLAFSALVLFMFCVDCKLDKDNVTVGGLLAYTALALIPIINVICFVGLIVEITTKTKFFSWKLF